MRKSCKERGDHSLKSKVFTPSSSEYQACAGEGLPHTASAVHALPWSDRSTTPGALVEQSTDEGSEPKGSDSDSFPEYHDGYSKASASNQMPQQTRAPPSDVASTLQYIMHQSPQVQVSSMHSSPNLS
ncbi:unnamed protein product, partial [Polarella glacialis]